MLTDTGGADRAIPPGAGSLPPPPVPPAHTLGPRSTLRRKALLIVAATMLGLMIIVFIPLRIFLLGSFINLEQQMMRTDVNRAISAIETDVHLLDTLNMSYAIWDDTYVFVDRPNQAYIDNNYYDKFFADNRLNLVLIVDIEGRLVFGKAYDLNADREVPVPRRFTQLTTSDPLIINGFPLRSLSGIVVLPEAPMLIAAHPIVTSQEQGPVRGTLMMGRYLDDAEIQYLAENTRLELSIHRLDRADLPEDIALARDALAGGAPTSSRPLNEQSIAGYTPLADLDAASSLILRVVTPRSVYAQGLIGIRSFMLSLLVVGLVFGVLMLALLERVVLSRLATLNHSVQRIRRRSDLSQRVTIDGDDELAHLTGSINAMLAALEQAEADRQEAQSVREKMLIQEEALRTKREFLAIVSHELRTPLTPITGYTELLLLGDGGDLTDDQRSLLETVRSNATRMTSLIDDLLEIGRIETNRVTLHFWPTDLAEVIAESCRLLETEIERREMTLVLEVAAALPIVHADRKRIEQVLTNLLSNAIKYNHSGGCITIRANQIAEGSVAVEVEDTGIGLSPEQQLRIFTPFYRADSPLRDQVRGSGLGLAIAKSFVDLHGGRISVRSEIGVGSVFTFTLPVRQSQD